MANMNQELIDKIVKSPVKFAVIKLFKENPFVMDNRFGLSLWVGKPEDILAQELEEMLDLGLLKKWGTDPGAIYAYTRDKEMRSFIDENWPEITRKAKETRFKDEKLKLLRELGYNVDELGGKE